jgi:hypothetical protein
VLACPAVDNDTRKRAPTSSPDPAADDERPDERDDREPDDEELEREDDDEPPDESDESDEPEDEDDEDDEDDIEDDNRDDEDDEDERRAKRRPKRSPEEEQKRHARFWAVGAIAVSALIGTIYGINCYLNAAVARQVSEHCFIEQQRLDQTLRDATEDRLPALEWNLNLYRARRRYVRELCDATVDELAWYRWNLGRRIEADVSEGTAQDISKVMSRAAMSCESEIASMEEALVREMSSRDSSDGVRHRVDELVQGQTASCQELSAAVAASRPGFWPPLKAQGTLDVVNQLGALMPRSWDEVSRRMEEPQ